MPSLLFQCTGMCKKAIVYWIDFCSHSFTYSTAGAVIMWRPKTNTLCAMCGLQSLQQ